MAAQDLPEMKTSDSPPWKPDGAFQHHLLRYMIGASTVRGIEDSYRRTHNGTGYGQINDGEHDGRW
jgi:hypothetical protein